MMQKEPTTRDLKIKTGILKRTHNEFIAYKTELEKQNSRIATLVETGADVHDINKQKEVLVETVDMLPDTLDRLKKAQAALKAIVSKVSSDDNEAQLLLNLVESFDYKWD